MDRLSAVVLALVAVLAAYYAVAAFFVWEILDKGTYIWSPSLVVYMAYV